MVDYELRAQVIESGLVKKVKQLKQQRNFAVGTNYYDYYMYEDLFLQCEDPWSYAEAVKAARADFARNTRLKNRIRTYLDNGSCIFLTLTFTNDVLEHTSAETRRKYVLRFLKASSSFYVANIDFGAQHGREHYHAIVMCDFVPLAAWTYGAINAQRVRQSSNPLIMAKYISKLVNHAIKETTKRSAIIYSRNALDEKREAGFFDHISPLLFPVWFTESWC